MDSSIKLSIILLNWNRLELLRGTFLSLVANTTAENEIIIVDNGSKDGSTKWIRKIESHYPRTRALLLEKNIGGLAINKALEICQGEYIHVSENDLEYLPGWDQKMISALEANSSLGLLSPFSPFPEKEFGEQWVRKEAIKREDTSPVLYQTETNIGSTGMFRTQDLRAHEIRWKNLAGNDENFLFPNDAEFSKSFRDAGFMVCWYNQYLAINWGHNESVIAKDADYYRENWNLKSELGIDGLNTLNTSKTAAANNEVTYALQKVTQELENLKKEHDPVTLMKLSEPGQPHFQIYVDCGEGFSENSAFRRAANWGSNSYLYEFDSPLTITNLRIDPLNLPCVARVKSLKLNDQAVEKGYISNAAAVREEIYYFATEDSQVTYDISEFGDIRSIEIEIEYLEIGVEASLTTAQILEKELQEFRENNVNLFKLFLSKKRPLFDDQKLFTHAKIGKNNFRYELTKPTKASYLRFEPLNRAIVIELRRVKLNGQNIRFEHCAEKTNAQLKVGSRYYFAIKNPFLVLELPESVVVEKIEIYMTILFRGTEAITHTAECLHKLLTECQNRNK